MNRIKSNLVLIGMPGSGKSTVGVILAKMTARDFVDTDVLIQTFKHQRLQDIVDAGGHHALREIEERVILGLSVDHHVIATGGSAVYSEPAMAHLKSNGTIVFLDVAFDSIVSRLGDFSSRGIAKRPDQSLAELFEERSRLYMKYADITIQCDRMNQDDVCKKIMDATGA
ncbi:MAG: shikimate kinase [Desulfobacteraceae bacterium]|nr:MAG: shikimate kinase [Desulfobacteraceae bacterium]